MNQASINATIPKLDDSWTSWVAENLMLGNEPASLLLIMEQNGIAIDTATHALGDIMQSPILAGAKRLQSKLNKREWILETLSRSAKCSTTHGIVERRDKLSTHEFLNEYYALNKPVLITGMMQDWPALSTWTLDRFERDFGSRNVEVQTRRESDPEFEINSNAHKETMKLAQLIQKIKAGASNDFYMTANNSGRNKEALRDLWKETGPISEYLDPGKEAQPGFLWLGPQGTLTPLHHDLTNNIMAQVFGSKRVRIIPANEMHLASNHFHCYSQVDPKNIDLKRFPAMARATVLVIDLHPGEILFLPIGCLHHVESLSASCTMTYTNFKFNNDFTSFYTTFHGL